MTEQYCDTQSDQPMMQVQTVQYFPNCEELQQIQPTYTQEVKPYESSEIMPIEYKSNTDFLLNQIHEALKELQGKNEIAIQWQEKWRNTLHCFIFFERKMKFTPAVNYVESLWNVKTIEQGIESLMKLTDEYVSRVGANISRLREYNEQVLYWRHSLDYHCQFNITLPQHVVDTIYKPISLGTHPVCNFIFQCRNEELESRNLRYMWSQYMNSLNEQFRSWCSQLTTPLDWYFQDLKEMNCWVNLAYITLPPVEPPILVAHSKPEFCYEFPEICQQNVQAEELATVNTDTVEQVAVGHEERNVKHFPLLRQESGYYSEGTNEFFNTDHLETQTELPEQEPTKDEEEIPASAFFFCSDDDTICTTELQITIPAVEQEQLNEVSVSSTTTDESPSALNSSYDFFQKICKEVKEFQPAWPEISPKETEKEDCKIAERKSPEVLISKPVPQAESAASKETSVTSMDSDVKEQCPAVPATGEASVPSWKSIKARSRNGVTIYSNSNMKNRNFSKKQSKKAK